MATTAFGTVLRRLRELRGFTLRELGERSDVDHAYIYRLENGQKSAPSTDAVDALVSALNADDREARLLQFLAGRDIPPALVDPSITEASDVALEDLESAALMSFRGKQPKTPEEWRRRIDKVREFREKYGD